MSESQCPICNKAIGDLKTAQFKPFCSQRCRSIDLGAWLGGNYRIAGESVDGESVANEMADAQRLSDEAEEQ